MYCSPHRKNNGQSCLTLTELRSVAALFNKEAEKQKLTKIDEGMFDNYSLLLSTIDSRLQSSCPNKKPNGKVKDHCWIEQPFVKSSELYQKLKNNFRPKRPYSWISNKRQWLTNFDILHVMKQYELAHQNFTFLGVFPIDFHEPEICHMNKICGFNLKTFKEANKTQIAVVLNLDKHNQPGSHWVAFVCDIDPASPKYGLCYFDSVGYKPPQTLKKFISDVRYQIEDINLGNKCVAKFNPTKKQYRGSECGVFSIFFIVQCLEYPKFTYKQCRRLVKTHRHDDYIYQLRKYYWRD